MGKELEAKLFKKYSSDMIKAILNPVEVAGKLYASEIIDAPTRDRVTKSDNGANDLIIAVETFILSQPDSQGVLGKRSGITSEIFKEILEIFKKYIPLNYVVKALEDEYHKLKQEMDSKEDNDSDDLETLPLKKYKADPVTTNKALPNEEHSIMEISLPTELTTTTTDVPSPQNACYDIFSDPHVKHLAEALKVYSSDLNKSELESEAIALIKARIEAHIKKRSEEHFPKESIKKHLTDLTMNALIPSDIVDWCYETLDKVYADLADSSVSSGSGEDPEDDCSANRELPPLFSKDTVYHASLCALALSLHPLQSSSILSDCGHSFDSISFSIDDFNLKMMIAQKGDIVYISFADDANPDIHKIIPMRYFCELLHQYKRLIFTGYSFGSYAAQNVLECLWESPFFNRDALLQNTACIMFGTHYHDVLYSKSNDVDSSSHLFVLQGELFNFFYRNNQISIFGDIVRMDDYNKLNIIIIKEQEGDINYEKLQGHSYSIHMSDFFKLIQDFSEIEMKDYHLKVLRGYLEKEPDPYPIPPRQDMSSIRHVQSLIPSISSVELHQHKHPEGYELAVVINGDNLWFCCEIKVIFDDIKDIKFEITPECVTQKQISYNFPLKSMITFQEVDVQVAVFSTFYNLSPEIYSTTYSVPNPISFRQSQLAKQTPSQIIQLSFLSALLEQSPTVQAGRPTRRFTSILKFLQESAHIVPLESITSAIAGCDNPDTACKCAQAFLSAAYSSPIPVSRLMTSGCENARNALGLGGYMHTWGHHRSYVESNLSRSYMEGYQTRSYLEGLPTLPHYSARPLVEYRDTLMVPPATIRYSDYYDGKKPSRQNKTGLAPPPPSAVVLDLTEKERRQLLDEFRPVVISHHFERFSKRLLSSFSSLSKIPDLICGRNIGEAYPISKASYSCSALTPLPMVLQKARHDLAIFSKNSATVDTGIGSRPKCNSDMLETVNNIIKNDLKPCVTMLGGFMEEQIRVPLVNNPLDTAKAIITAERSGAVGVWALFAMSFDDIVKIPKSRKNQALVIQITKFIKGLSSEEIKKQEDDKRTTTYNAKLQFLLQGMRSTITCSSHYISYSLERELVEFCKERNISTSTRIDTIISGWDFKFESTALVLVPHQYRPLLVRWLIWALNIHQLRESLASYTTVGVIGLVNSGKSTLVNKVFKIKTIQGTTQSARTTVPLIYNLDNEVEGLSVIDFPGVDDKDDSIGGLAKLLVGLAQIVIFVCEYKRFHTKSAEEWMEIFHKDFDSSPILVCLTNADRLYEDQCDDDMIPSCPEGKVSIFKMQLENELKATIGPTKIPHNCVVKFCSLIQSKRSQLNNEEGRQSMRKVGIFTPEDIGHWIKRALEINIQQKDLADKLGRFLAKQK